MTYICSVQSRNLRNPGIALRELGINTLARIPGIAQGFAQTYNALRKPEIINLRSSNLEEVKIFGD